MRTPRLSKPEAHLLQSPEPGRFVAAELERLPEPARRHLAQAIAPGTPLVTSARLRMRGHIKVGRLDCSSTNAAAKDWPASGPLPWGSNDPDRPLPVGRR